MKQKKKNQFKFIAAAAVLTLALTGCSEKQEGTNGSASSTDGSNSAAEVTKIVAATEGQTRPLTYLDESGELTGYEVEVLKAIDEELKEYEIEILTTEFASIFTGMDSGLYQVGFNNISKTKEREEKYAFPENTHYYEGAGFFVTKGLLETHPVDSIEDLGGLKTICNSKGDSWQLFVEAYNEKYTDNPIEVAYSDEDWASLYLKVYKGEIDILKGVESRLEMYEDEYGYEFDFVNLPEEDVEDLGSSEHYFVISNTEEGQKLAEAFNGAIKKLGEDGTLTKLSIEFLGKDYSGTETSE